MYFRREFILELLTLAIVAAKTGYFWHITDLHWDPNYNNVNNNCWRGGTRIPQGKFGEHSCDSSWKLIESAVYFMKEKYGDDIEFILWTGDGLTHTDTRSCHQKLTSLQNLTHLLSHVFSSQFVFPVLGHDDPCIAHGKRLPYENLTNLWRQWLPNDAINTFSRGGYYMIEQRMRKLRLIALNTNLFVKNVEEKESEAQWEWIERVLNTSYHKQETVYLVGHMAPGSDERQGTPPRPSMAPHHNSRYLNIVKKYAGIITGQFFGHLHSDTFRVIYSDTGNPVSYILLAPSVTPRLTSSGINNPGLRIYKFDTDTGQWNERNIFSRFDPMMAASPPKLVIQQNTYRVLDNDKQVDYVQYYMDLTSSNQKDTAEWILEYNLTTYYGFNQVSPTKLHQLAESFTIPEGMPLFVRYYQANSVRSYDLQVKNAGANAHYCAITRLEQTQYQNCLATAASALAASESSSIKLPNFYIVSITTVFLSRLALR